MTRSVTAIRTIWGGITVLLVSASAEGLIVPMIEGRLLDGTSPFEHLMLWLARDHRGALIGAGIVAAGAYRLFRTWPRR